MTDIETGNLSDAVRCVLSLPAIP